MRLIWGQVALVVGDRRHWELDTWRLNVGRWCPGAPCHLPGVAYRQHWISFRLWRRAWSVRYDEQERGHGERQRS